MKMSLSQSFTYQDSGPVEVAGHHTMLVWQVVVFGHGGLLPWSPGHLASGGRMPLISICPGSWYDWR